MKRKRTIAAAGFTLIEIMMAMAITAIVMSALVTVFKYQQDTYSSQTDLANSQAKARAALNLMARDIRMAGYSGIPLAADRGPLLEPTPYYPVVTHGGTLPYPVDAPGDRIEIWGNFIRRNTNLDPTTPATAGLTDRLKVVDFTPFAGTGLNQPGWVAIGSGTGVMEILKIDSLSSTTNEILLGATVVNDYDPASSWCTVSPYFKWEYYVGPHPTFKDNQHPPQPLPTLWIKNYGIGDGNSTLVEMATGVDQLLVRYQVLDHFTDKLNPGCTDVCDPCSIRIVDLRIRTYSDKLRSASRPLHRWFTTSVRIRNIGFEERICKDPNKTAGCGCG